MSVNKVILLGRLGKDPELRSTQSGQRVATFSLATTERSKDKGGNSTEKTEWHNIVVWGKTAELAAKYLQKGRQVYLEGRIQTRKWQDKEGKDRYSTEIVAQNLTFVGGGKSGGEAEATPIPDASAYMAKVPEVDFDQDDIPF
jgi:single-strand DNA-binding protein